MALKFKIREYQAEAITVKYDLKRCIHAEECVHGLPTVFDKSARPWIQPENASAAEIADVILRCPTGALQFERKDDGASEPIPTENTILLSADGPLYVQGEVEITRRDGSVLHRDTRVALCRCGTSKYKPFCDNAHLDIEFQADGSVADNQSETDASTTYGPLKITLAPNGAYRLQGNFEIRNTDGQVSFRGNRTALCRCGGSQNKPFCDMSHRSIGFIAD